MKMLIVISKIAGFAVRNQLPLVTLDAEKHFAKRPTYKQEIRHLLQCRGCPYIVQLLGRTEEGIVFPKFKRPFNVTALLNLGQGRIQNIKRWIFDVIDGVVYLHSLGIVHRDLARRNILEADPLVICDLQCLHATGHCRPFEIDDGDHTTGKFSFASDVFGLGALLWECCFYGEVLLDNLPPPSRISCLHPEETRGSSHAHAAEGHVQSWRLSQGVFRLFNLLQLNNLSVAQ
jgi:serine/threonine protein kinase